MSRSMTVMIRRCLRRWRVLGVLALALALAACSRVELAYEHADWIAARYIADYLDLDRAERHAVRQRLQEVRATHRRERAPALAGLLDALADDLEAGRLDRQRLEGHVDAFTTHFQGSVEDLLPEAAETLAGLERQQVRHLDGRLTRARQEYVDDVGDATPGERRARRLERTAERIEDWVGTLDRAQVAHLHRCNARAPDTTEQWLAWRGQREGRLIELLNDGAQPEAVTAELREWWLDGDAPPRDLRQARTITREVWIDCMAEFLPELTPTQTDRLVTRLRGYRDSFQAIAAAAPRAESRSAQPTQPGRP